MQVLFKWGLHMAWRQGRGWRNCQVPAVLHEGESKCQYFTKLRQQTSLLADSSDKNMMQTAKVTHKAIILVVIGEKKKNQDNNIIREHNI